MNGSIMGEWSSKLQRKCRIESKSSDKNRNAVAATFDDSVRLCVTVRLQLSIIC